MRARIFAYSSGLVWAVSLLFLAMWMAAPGVARAQTGSVEEVQALYTDGNFLAAAEMATQMDSADALSTGARARIIRAAYLLPRERAVAELEKAEADLRRALSINPDHAEAATNLAIVLGYRARVEGYVAAYFAGLAKEAKDLIDRARAEDPLSSWGRVVEGAWNAEIVLGAGPNLAESLYGATVENAIKNFEAAVALDPMNATIRLEYAKAIIKLSGEAGWTAAKGHLAYAALAEAPTRYNRIIRERALRLDAALATGSAETVAKCMHDIDPFSEP